MKLLVLLSRIPYPLEKGDKLRAFHQIRELSKYNEIYLIALNNGKIHSDAKNELLKFCKQVHFFQLNNIGIFYNLILSFFTGKPMQTGYFFNSRIAFQILGLIKEIKPEHIYCQLIRTAEYVKNVEIRKTIDYQDAFSKGMERRAERSHGFMRWFFKMEANRLYVYEQNIFKYFNHHTIISRADVDLMPDSIRNNIEIIPNGVDFEYFLPKVSSKEFDVVFTGNMNYAPNILAANYLVNEIMPLVWETKRNCKVLISGADPHKSVQELKSKNVMISGWVEDIRTSYSKSKVFVAPMQIGTGLQNKLLEAMAMKIPCITSDLANNALKAKNKEEILVANLAKEYADLIIFLLDNPHKANEQAELAYQFVKTNYSWSKSVEKLNTLFNS